MQGFLKRVANWFAPGTGGAESANNAGDGENARERMSDAARIAKKIKRR